MFEPKWLWSQNWFSFLPRGENVKPSWRGEGTFVERAEFMKCYIRHLVLSPFSFLWGYEGYLPCSLCIFHQPQGSLRVSHGTWKVILEHEAGAFFFQELPWRSGPDRRALAQLGMKNAWSGVADRDGEYLVPTTWCGKDAWVFLCAQNPSAEVSGAVAGLQPCLFPRL